MLNKSGFRIFIQIIAALSLLLLPLFIRIFPDHEYNLTGWYFLKYILFCLIFIMIYFIHSRYLFPTLYLRSKTGYLILLLLFSGAVIWLKPFQRWVITTTEKDLKHEISIEKGIRSDPEISPLQPLENIPDKRPFIDFVSILFFLLTISTSIWRKMNNHYHALQQQGLIAEVARCRSELFFQKTQVNPDLLFNTLNTIYKLTIHGQASSPGTFSDMMRYIIKDSRHHFVDLQQEMDCIVDYIHLQQLQLTRRTKLTFETEGVFKGIKIAPLILMALVEQVFIHGISSQYDGDLMIAIQASQRTIKFYSQHNIYPEPEPQQHAGIGLETTLQRLNDYYPQKHTISTHHYGDFFEVDLTILLS